MFASLICGDSVSLVFSDNCTHLDFCYAFPSLRGGAFELQKSETEFGTKTVINNTRTAHNTDSWHPVEKPAPTEDCTRPFFREVEKWVVESGREAAKPQVSNSVVLPVPH